MYAFCPTIAQVHYEMATADSECLTAFWNKQNGRQRNILKYISTGKFTRFFPAFRRFSAYTTIAA